MSKISKKKQPAQVEVSFINFLKQQQNVLLIISGVYIAIYFLLTYLYPYPDGISDSGGYVKAALVNQEDGYRPFGYSKFLILVHALSSSISLVVFFQFLLNALASVYFIFTIKYFFKSNDKYLDYIYYFLSIFSITVLYLTDSLLSDSLFTSLTLIWLTLGIWFSYNKKTYQSIIFFVLHIIVLVFLINVRYTGLFYSGFTVIIVLLTFYRKSKLKSIGISIIPILIVLIFYSNHTQKTKERTGIETFSGFSGWLMANNALNVLPYIKLNTSKIEDKEVKEFAEFAVKYDTLLKPLIKPSATFFWDKKMPLKQFLFFKIQQNKSPYVKTWTYLGKNVYGKFGTFIIINYPFSYLRYYLLPNLLRTLYPTSDELTKNGFKKNAVPKEILEKWFHLNKEMYSNSDVIKKTSKFIPIYRLLVWILMFLVIFYFFIKRKKIKLKEFQVKSFWFIIIFILSYFAFNVYAAPFELRYIGPIHLLQITIIYIGLGIKYK